MRSPSYARWSVLAVTLAYCVSACMTYEQELGRADDHFAHDESERALATLRALESDFQSLGIREQARYCYLRGLIDYRVGFKADARHWMAFAVQIDRRHPGALLASERSRILEKLHELNALVWSGQELPIEELPGVRTPQSAGRSLEEGATPKRTPTTPLEPHSSMQGDDTPPNGAPKSDTPPRSSAPSATPELPKGP